MAENNFEEMAKDVLNTADTTSSFDQNDIESNKIMAVLAYIGILFLIPLLVAKDSKFAKFHTNQGIVLFIADIAIGVVITIVAIILAFIPVVGPIITAIVSGVLGLAIFALMILGIINAATGKAKELPLIGKIKILK